MYVCGPITPSTIDNKNYYVVFITPSTIDNKNYYVVFIDQYTY